MGMGGTETTGGGAIAVAGLFSINFILSSNISFAFVALSTSTLRVAFSVFSVVISALSVEISVESACACWVKSS